jgi:hypothetical protein
MGTRAGESFRRCKLNTFDPAWVWHTGVAPEGGPASLPAGPFVKLPELSGRCHAASAGAAGAATAAACLTGRGRRCARQRHNCCNQE